MKRKYKGSQRIALIRKEVEDTIKELQSREFHCCDIDLYYKTQWYGAKGLAERLKQAIINSDTSRDVDKYLESRSWRSREGFLFITSKDYSNSWYEAIKKPFGKWCRTEKQEEEEDISDDD